MRVPVVLRKANSSAAEDQKLIEQLTFRNAQTLSDAGADLSDPFLPAITKLGAMTTFWALRSSGVLGTRVGYSGLSCYLNGETLERQATVYFLATQAGMVTTIGQDGLPYFDTLDVHYKNAQQTLKALDIKHKDPCWVSMEALYPTSAERLTLIILAALGGTSCDHWTPYQQLMGCFGASLVAEFFESVLNPWEPTRSISPPVITPVTESMQVAEDYLTQLASSQEEAPLHALHDVRGESQQASQASDCDKPTLFCTTGNDHTASHRRCIPKGLFDTVASWYRTLMGLPSSEAAEFLRSDIPNPLPSLVTDDHNDPIDVAAQREALFKRTLDAALAHASATEREELLAAFAQFKNIN